MQRTITVTSYDKEPRRYDLRGAIDLGLSTHMDGYGTGLRLDGVYLMPKSRRVLVQTYSVWENRQTHGCVGEEWHVADLEEIAHLAGRFDCEQLRQLIPAGD